MTTDNPTPQPTNTKARFDAERTAAGYKYIDSLRELMKGQPVGEGGMPEILPCPFQVNGGLHDIRHEHGKVQCRQHTKWIRRDVWNTRAAQPATAPNDSAHQSQLRQAFDDGYLGGVLTGHGEGFEEGFSEAVKLLRCPICGNTASVSGVSVVCDGCGLTLTGKDAEDAAGAWNLRPTPTDITERARRAVGKLARFAQGGWLTNMEKERWADIIAAEFGGCGSSRST
jgi:hypothetical protein